MTTATCGDTQQSLCKEFCQEWQDSLRKIDSQLGHPQLDLKKELFVKNTFFEPREHDCELSSNGGGSRKAKSDPTSSRASSFSTELSDNDNEDGAPNIDVPRRQAVDTQQSEDVLRQAMQLRKLHMNPGSRSESTQSADDYTSLHGSTVDGESVIFGMSNRERKLREKIDRQARYAERKNDRQAKKNEEKAARDQAVAQKKWNAAPNTSRMLASALGEKNDHWSLALPSIGTARHDSKTNPCLPCVSWSHGQCNFGRNCKDCHHALHKQKYKIRL